MSETTEKVQSQYHPPQRYTETKPAIGLISSAYSVNIWLSYNTFHRAGGVSLINERSPKLTETFRKTLTLTLWLRHTIINPLLESCLSLIIFVYHFLKALGSIPVSGITVCTSNNNNIYMLVETVLTHWGSENICGVCVNTYVSVLSTTMFFWGRF